MITKKEAKRLRSILNTAEDPSAVFGVNELDGYLFAVVITPEIIAPSEWAIPIFGHEMSEFENLDEIQNTMDCLLAVFNRFQRLRQQRKLYFPFDVEHLQAGELNKIRSWSRGFLSGIRLRFETWMMFDSNEIPLEIREDVEYSIAVLQTVAHPEEVDELLEPPSEHHSLVDSDEEELRNRLMQTLIAILPKAVDTLLRYSQRLEEKLLGESEPESKSQKSKGDRLCSCGSGKAYTECCGANRPARILH